MKWFLQQVVYFLLNINTFVRFWNLLVWLEPRKFKRPTLSWIWWFSLGWSDLFSFVSRFSSSMNRSSSKKYAEPFEANSQAAPSLSVAFVLSFIPCTYLDFSSSKSNSKEWNRNLLLNLKKECFHQTFMSPKRKYLQLYNLLLVYDRKSCSYVYFDR